jgi:eukaryotic-like serine/threonine-protein kinase
MSLTSGTRLGPYEIQSPIGAGGMGEVYKARDTRLDRTVAIKILPPDVSADPDRRARFEREAKAVAALNHPNIVTIYAVEDADGVPFFSMEYVDGRTLAQLIPPRGLPLDEVLRITIPLTDAVAAAHERGILHRDLKPANVMMTAEGRVKVLDFGLAKLKEAVVEADDGARPTAEATGEGRILGTVAYMSPEQAEGKELDQRSDIFSLGVLLYEMVTGQRPFKGETSVSIISSILKDTPGSITDFRPDVPRDLARIIKRALNKDPEHRYQTAKDLRNDLEDLQRDLDSGELLRLPGGPAESGARWRRLSLFAGALLAVVSLAVLGTWWAFGVLKSPEQAVRARAFDDFTLTRLTTEQVSDYTAAVSDDGRFVAYGFVEQGREGLRVRQVETPTAVQVVPPADVRYWGVTFSPDGNRLYYAVSTEGSDTETLYEVSVLGGSPRRVLEDVSCRIGFSPDGTRFAFVRKLPQKGAAVIVANTDGTGERVLAARSIPNEFSTGVDVAWSGDGRLISAAIYDGSHRTIVVTVDAATGAVQEVGGKKWDDVWSIAWPRDGSHLIIAATDRAVDDARQIWEVALPSGPARRITKDVASYQIVALTPDARTLVTVREEWRGTLWVGPSAQPDRAARIGSVPDTVSWGMRTPIRWTADGRILFTANVGGNYDIWAVRPDGGDLRQLTTQPGVDGYPTPAPDGRYIAFLSDRDGHVRVWRMESDGGRQTLLTPGSNVWSPLLGPDGRSVFYVRHDQPGFPLYKVPVDGGAPVLLAGSPAEVPAGQRWEVQAGFEPEELSPDGTLILGSYTDERRRRRLAVVRANGQALVQIPDIELPSGAGSRSYAWAPGGQAITFVRTTAGTANLWRQPLDGGPAARLASYPPGEAVVLHAWSSDGKMVALVRGTSNRQVVLMRDVTSRR